MSGDLHFTGFARCGRTMTEKQMWADHVTVLGPCRLCGRDMISSSQPLCQAWLGYDWHVVPGRDFCIRCYSHDPCDVGWRPECCGAPFPLLQFAAHPGETMCEYNARQRDGAA